MAPTVIALNWAELKVSRLAPMPTFTASLCCACAAGATASVATAASIAILRIIIRDSPSGPAACRTRAETKPGPAGMGKKRPPRPGRDQSPHVTTLPANRPAEEEVPAAPRRGPAGGADEVEEPERSEEHTSELQS